ncbi:MAG: hypothetical protein WAM61_05155, partial [Desulfobacterales bacterium]
GTLLASFSRAAHPPVQADFVDHFSTIPSFQHSIWFCEILADVGLRFAQPNELQHLNPEP